MNDKVTQKTDYPTINDWLDVTIGTICEEIRDNLILITYQSNQTEREKIRNICENRIQDIYTIIGKS